VTFSFGMNVDYSHWFRVTWVKVILGGRQVVEVAPNVVVRLCIQKRWLGRVIIPGRVDF